MIQSGLSRFLKAQEGQYQIALSEIKNGKKQSHWMWYIFPQLKGLGHSPTADYYGIKDLEEATLYLADPLLGKRLEEISNTLLQLPSNNANMILGSPDDMKLRSSMTLFNAVPQSPSVFQKVLDKFFEGKSDERTIRLLKHA